MSWPMVDAAELMLRRGGSINPAKFPDEIFDLLSIPSYDKQEIEILAGSDIGSSKSIVAPGDVLLSKIIPHIRRCWVVPGSRGRKQIGSGEWIIFRDNRFHPPFLRHFLMSNIFHMQFMNTVAGVGGSLVRARPAEVERIKIPLPPLPIQKQIAEVLEKADTLRQQCQQMEQELNAIAQAVFLEMFGDPVKNPKSWQKKSLSTVTDKIIDCPHTTPKWTVDGITCLRTTNLTHGGWNFADHRFVDAEQYKERTSRSEIEPGDIILSREGTVGVAAIVDVGMKLCLGQRLVQVRPNLLKIHSEFLLYQLLFLLTPERLTQVMSGSTVKHLNMSDIRSLKVIVPPIENQIQFKQIWTSIKDKLSKANQQMSSLDECFNSLMQRAFKGELDLKTSA